MLMSAVCEHPPCLLHAPLRERMPLKLAETCAYVYGGSSAMARRDAVVQPYQFDPESDSGEATEEIQTLRLQQDVSEWLVYLNMLLILFACVVTFTTM